MYTHSMETIYLFLVHTGREPFSGNSWYLVEIGASALKSRVEEWKGLDQLDNHFLIQVQFVADVIHISVINRCG